MPSTIPVPRTPRGYRKKYNMEFCIKGKDNLKFEDVEMSEIIKNYNTLCNEHFNLDLKVQELFNKAADAETTSRTIANDYNEEFYSKKPNGTNFNSSRNNIERGMYAFTRRNITGSKNDQDIEFARRKKLVDRSIKRLRENDDSARADVYQEIFDKILKDSNNAAEVDAKVDGINKEACLFGQPAFLPAQCTHGP